MIPKVVHEGVTVTVTIKNEQVAVTSFVGRKGGDEWKVEGYGLRLHWKERDKTRFFFEGGSSRIHTPADFYRARKVIERLIPALAQARGKMRPIELRALRVCLELVTRPQTDLPHASMRKIARHLSVRDRMDLVNTLHSLKIESEVLKRILQETRPVESQTAIAINGTGPLRITHNTRYLSANALPNSS